MATAWAVPKDWEGLTVAVLATGPSLTPDVAEAVRQAGIRTIAISDAFRLAPWADILWSCDAKWWLQHAQDALKFSGRKATLDGSCPFPQVYQLQNGGQVGYDERPTHLRTGGNSGHQAVHLAAHLGAARIILCGFDMRIVNGQRHFFGDHPKPLDKNSPYPEFISDFEFLAEALKDRGVQVVNTTPNSALRCFPSASLEKELHRCALPA